MRLRALYKRVSLAACAGVAVAATLLRLRARMAEST